LDARSEVGNYAFSLANHIAELRFADFQRFRSLGSGDAVMGNGITDESGGRV